MRDREPRRRDSQGRAIGLLTAAATIGILAMPGNTALGAGTDTPTSVSGQPTPDRTPTTPATASTTATPEASKTPTTISTPDNTLNCVLNYCNTKLGQFFGPDGVKPLENGWTNVNDPNTQLNVGANQLLVMSMLTKTPGGSSQLYYVLINDRTGILPGKDTDFQIISGKKVEKEWFIAQLNAAKVPVQFAVLNSSVNEISPLFFEGKLFVPTSTPSATASTSPTRTATALVDRTATAYPIYTNTSAPTPTELPTATPTPSATVTEITTFTPTVTATSTATATEIPATPTPIPPFVVEVPRQQEEPVSPAQAMRIKFALDTRGSTLENIANIGLRRALKEGIEIPEDLQRAAVERVKERFGLLMRYYTSASELLRDKDNKDALEGEAAQALAPISTPK